MYFDTYQDGSAIAIGDTIPLWSLNEDTGIWLQEGVGTVVASTESPTGLAMNATVGHFSWWNCDVSANAAQAIVTVTAPEAGTALIKARTNASIGWRPNTVETVATVGIPTQPLSIPSNGEVCFWAEITFDLGGQSTTPETCVNAAPNATVIVNVVSAVAGPVMIVTTPAATAGVLNMNGYLGFPTERVQLQPSTLETVVNYTMISGSLPFGLVLNAVNATRSEIVGVVAQLGTFSAVFQAADIDGNTDTVTINYTVSADIPPPVLEPLIWVNYTNAQDSFDMNTYNTGGPATDWQLDFDGSLEEFQLPPYITLNPTTGILTVTESCRHWQGFITATNSSGSVKVTLVVSGFNACG